MAYEKISAFIITKNEERNIKRALESIKWADEIIVVDGYSTDQTCQIAKKYGAKIISSKFEGFDAEKNKAIKACKYDWIIEIDADEELTAGSEVEIRKACLSKEFSGFEFMREERFLGRLLIKAKKIRLYQNKFFYKNYTHEVLQISGKIGSLKSVIKHYNNQNVNEFIEYVDYESTQEVDKMFKEGKKYSKWGILWRMPYVTIKNFGIYYIYLGLIFKGFAGLSFTIIACFHANIVLIKYYEKMYIKNNKK